MKIKILLSVLLCAALMLVSCGDHADDKDPAETTGTASDPAYLKEPLKHVGLATYKGLEIQVDEAAVQSSVDGEISNLLSANKQMEEISGPSEKGDTLTVDFEGFVEGVRHENACAENQTITLGAGGFIAGFEEALYGVSTGDEFAVDLTFPDNYYEDLAGKPVQFKFTVHKIERNMTEYNDALVAANTDFATAAEYEAALREDAIFSYKLSTLWETVVSTSSFTLPTDEVDAYVEEGVAYYASYASQMSMTLDELCQGYFGMTEDQLREELQKEAEDMLKSELVIYGIAETEGLEVTDEIYTERMQIYLDMYGYASIEDMEVDYSRETLQSSILRDMVYELIVDTSVEK